MRRFVLVFSVVLTAIFVFCVARITVIAQPSQGSHSESWEIPYEKIGKVTPSVEAVEDPYFRLIDDSMGDRFRPRGWEDQRADDQTFGKSYVGLSKSALRGMFDALGLMIDKVVLGTVIEKHI